jgi:uncharacterized protein (DUF849 family)
MDKLIITAAITGAAIFPTQTEYLPITPQQIADEAVRAAEAGAASVHIHARNPKDGMPTADLGVYREIVTEINRRSNVIVCITTGGSLTATREERISVIPTFKPELASLNCGSLSFGVGVTRMIEKLKPFKCAWEQPFLEYLHDAVFSNTGKDMEYFATVMKENDTKPEHEAYDAGHINNIGALLQGGFTQAPLWIQFVMGGGGGVGGTPEDVIHMKRTADRILGIDTYKWSVIGVGYPTVFNCAALAMMMGGHVRVGMEDNIFISKMVKTKSNGELVEKAVRIAKELGREIASPDEARQMLGLKGRDKVNF